MWVHISLHAVRYRGNIDLLCGAIGGALFGVFLGIASYITFGSEYSIPLILLSIVVGSISGKIVMRVGGKVVAIIIGFCAPAYLFLCLITLLFIFSLSPYD